MNEGLVTLTTHPPTLPSRTPTLISFKNQRPPTPSTAPIFLFLFLFSFLFFFLLHSSLPLSFPSALFIVLLHLLPSLCFCLFISFFLCSPSSDLLLSYPLKSILLSSHSIPVPETHIHFTQHSPHTSHTLTQRALTVLVPLSLLLKPNDKPTTTTNNSTPPLVVSLTSSISSLQHSPDTLSPFFVPFFFSPYPSRSLATLSSTHPPHIIHTTLPSLQSSTYPTHTYLPTICYRCFCCFLLSLPTASPIYTTYVHIFSFCSATCSPFALSLSSPSTQIEHSRYLPISTPRFFSSFFQQ